MRLIRVFVGAALHHGEVLLVPGERFEAFGQFPVRASFGLVRKPSLVGDAPTEAEEDHPLRRRRRGSAGEAPEADRFEGRQGDERAGAAKKVAAGFHGSGEVTRTKGWGQGNGMIF